MSVTTGDNTSSLFLASMQQQPSSRFSQKDSFLARSIHTTTKQLRREPLMIPYHFLSSLFSDFSFHLSYIVPAISHILNEVLPSSLLQSFPKYFPSWRRRREKEGALYWKHSPVPPPDLSLIMG